MQNMMLRIAGEEAEESEEIAGEGERMSDGDDSPAIEIEIKIEAEDPTMMLRKTNQKDKW